MFVFYDAFRDIPKKGNYSHHLFIDVETTETGAALVIRGEDQSLFPASKARMVWNERDGSARRFVVAEGSKDEMMALHGAILALYLVGDHTRIVELESVDGALAVYAVISWLFPLGAFNKSFRRVDSYASRVLSRHNGKKAREDTPVPSDEAVAAMIAQAQGK